MAVRIKIDAALFSRAVSELRSTMQDEMFDRGRAGFALGVLHALEEGAEGVVSGDPQPDPTTPWRREVELLAGAIKDAGFRIDRLGDGGVRLFRIGENATRADLYRIQAVRMRDAITCAGFRFQETPSGPRLICDPGTPPDETPIECSDS